jgi:acetyl-CoA carboxylase biotin carboxylase subunit
MFSGYKIPPYYDSMVAKLIVYGDDREQALARCRRALDEFVVDGVKTTIPFTQIVLNNKDFVAGKYNTGYLEKIIQEGF